MEIFRKVIGYEEKYEVSNLGNVRSLDTMTLGRWKNTKRSNGRTLKPHICRQGYLRFTLCKKGERCHKLAHRLVAQAFLDNSSSLPAVNHKNGIKSDNRVENLEWISNRNNSIHAEKNGLLKHRKGSNHPNVMKTHCPYGHEYSPENTSLYTKDGVSGYRRCKTCNRLTTRRIRSEQRTKLNNILGKEE